MKQSLKIGICFGITSGIITTLGLMTGLSSGTNSKLAVIGGILTIAIADAFSDALGIHISTESDNKNTLETWESTLSTFFSKFLFALTFVVPVILFDLQLAVIISAIWGLLVLGILSYIIAKFQKQNILNAILEHLTTALFVIFATYYIGKWIAVTFN